MNTLALHDRQVRSLQKVCLRHCHLSRVKLRRSSLPALIVAGWEGSIGQAFGQLRKTSQK